MQMNLIQSVNFKYKKKKKGKRLDDISCCGMNSDEHILNIMNNSNIIMQHTRSYSRT